MNISRAKIFMVAISLALSACTAQQSGPDPAYVSPTQYSGYNCKQVRAEMGRVSGKLEQATQNNTTGQVMNTAVSIFAISRGYGVYNDGGDDIEFRRLRNQYDVLEQTAIQKQCNL